LDADCPWHFILSQTVSLKILPLSDAFDLETMVSSSQTQQGIHKFDKIAYNGATRIHERLLIKMK
jgi:hypothetical protein